jgi:coproporphyrinogen III oxidase-like Fe-S oxidoreductase
MQYPPPFLSENDFDNDSYIHSFDSERENCGLYIHIPFCETKCTFCRYYSIIDTSDEAFEKYCSFLIKELALYVPLIK